MAINFPSNPQVDDKFSPPGSNVVYTWSGNFWDVYTYSATFVSASWAKTSSFAQNGAGGGTAATASYAATASTALELITTASQTYTASFAKNAATASYVSGSNVKGTVSSSLTASLAENAITSSYALVAQFAYSSSFSTVTQSSVSSASWASSSIWSLYATQSLTASTALSASNADSASTSRFAITASYLIGAVDTASYIDGRNVKGQLTGSISGTTAVFSTAVIGSVTSSLLGTASYAVTASRAVTASYTITASAVDVPGFNTNLTYELHVSSGSGDDTTGNGTVLRPFRTVNRASTWFSQSLAALSGSQTGSGYPAAAIFVHPGTYPEIVTQSFPEISITSYLGNMHDHQPGGYFGGNQNDGVYINFIATRGDWRGRTARYSNISVGGVFSDEVSVDGNNGNAIYNNCRIVSINPGRNYLSSSYFNCDIGDYGSNASLFGSSNQPYFYFDSCRIYSMSQNSSRNTQYLTTDRSFSNTVIRNSRIENMKYNFGNLSIYNSLIIGPASYSAYTPDSLLIADSQVVKSAVDVKFGGGLFITGVNQTFPAAANQGVYGVFQNVTYDTASSTVKIWHKLSGSTTQPTENAPFFSKLRAEQLSVATFSVNLVPSASRASTAYSADYVNASGIIGAVANATDATNATNATNATFASIARFLQGTGSNIINGSLRVTGSITSTTSITASSVTSSEVRTPNLYATNFYVGGVTVPAPAIWATTSYYGGTYGGGQIRVSLPFTFSYTNPANISICMQSYNTTGLTIQVPVTANIYLTASLAGVAGKLGPTSGPGLFWQDGGWTFGCGITTVVTWNP